jgi:hypothetical protein
MPLSRGEDAVFGALLLTVSPHNFVGHLPVALFHNSDVGRVYQSEPEFRITIIISLAAMYQPAGGNDVRSSLRSIGRYFEDLAALPDNEFWTIITRGFRSLQANWLRRWFNNLQEADEWSPHWKYALREGHMRAAMSLTDSLHFIPVEFTRAFATDLAKRETRQFVRRFGKLLQTWPDILSVARELKKREIRIAKPIV